MLEALGYQDLESFIQDVVPSDIRFNRELNLPEAATEYEALSELRGLVSENEVRRSFIGAGYHGCLTPPVIQRNILENPGWYTQYTAYQAEISQGRLEMLLNFQTMVSDLTGLEIANASLLDEGTAAAEAIAMAGRVSKLKNAKTVFVSTGCHPQTLEVLRSRTKPLGYEILTGDHRSVMLPEDTFAVLVQYPATDGAVHDYAEFFASAKERGIICIVAADLLALTLLTPPGEFGADIAVGSAQRFGVPMGFGGPHAAYFATKDVHKRAMPGRVVGLSKDAAGRPAYRLAMQTREQHIRRDKATSNICTAQVLLAVMAAAFALYHGATGLREIAAHITRLTRRLAAALNTKGITHTTGPLFDTLVVEADETVIAEILQRADSKGVNLRRIDARHVGVSLDETSTEVDLADLVEIFTGERSTSTDESVGANFPAALARSSDFLTHDVFQKYRTETELMRYLKRLESRDLSLTTSMIALGSCTMKLNAAAEMFPVSWPEINGLHPYAPESQTRGYARMIHQLEDWLAEITGFAAVSLQPNAGSQGEFAGLLAIRAFHRANGQPDRNLCLIPLSAHGTNPASATMAGMQVVGVACDADGNVDMADLQKKIDAAGERLGALMVTYPSTHGVFETTIREICDNVHAAGGQVYMDGANMNAQVGLCRPGDFGADVCHLNLHKTFCIPHGGGGPGVGPVCLAEHLAPYVPGFESVAGGVGIASDVPAVAAAPYGSASILVIPWIYIRSMGAAGLTRATKVAILSANYIAKRLDGKFPVLYKGRSGLVAHECVLDLRDWKDRIQVGVEDVAKRLMDYGFHSPTMSWPVAGTLMVEPTESESLAELDRFCDAMIAIYGEIKAIENGEADAEINPLRCAPHPAADLLADDWDRPYSRDMAAYPAPWTREHKFWPVVSRVDNVFGDRNLICSCPTVAEMVGVE